MNASNSRRLSLLTVTVVAIAISGCGGGNRDNLGRPAGRPVVDGNVGASPQPAAQQANAGQAPAAQPTDVQRVEMLARYDELLAELRDLRDLVEQQQFENERMQKSYNEQMRRMDLRIAENGGTLAELQQQQQFTASGSEGLPSNVTRAPGNTYQTNTNSNNQPTQQATSTGVQPEVVRPASVAGATNANAERTPVVTIGSNGTTTNRNQPTAVATAQPATTPANNATATAVPATPGNTAKAAPATVATATSARGRDQYDAAFEMLKQSRYNDAINGFEGFIQANPNTDLADDARYWVGEAHYVSRDLTQAVSSFQQLVVDYPQSARTPDALLKIGYIQYELGSFAESRSTLATILDRFPSTPVATAAAARLEKMAREGN